MMSNEDQLTPEQLACEVCLKEIPASGASSDETSDYVASYCGLECYEIWKGQNKKAS